MKKYPDLLSRAWHALSALDGREKLFFILAATQAGMVWLHRSFPTQDGPMQIYVADVLEDLIRGTGNYSNYYQVQGYAHPYSFFIYALTLLNQLFHPLTSERILVCVYFAAFSLSARFLIQSIRAENHWLPLFMLPFALNTYLCLGIYNFTFATVILMLMMGIWLRWSGAWKPIRSLLWLALLMLLAAMHHVPLLILGVFLGIHMAAVTVLSIRSSLSDTIAGKMRAAWRRVRGDFANAALLAAPLGWYAVFAVPAAQSGAKTVSSVQVTWVDRIRDLLNMVPLSPYLGFGYCFCLLLFVVAPVALVLLQPARSSFASKPATGCALSITATVCLAVYVFGPHFLFGHGHGYFAERMAVPFVICCLAAVAPLRIPVTLERIMAAFAACLFLWMLSVRERQTASMVAELAPVYDAKPRDRGFSGAIVSGTESLEGFMFNPYFWAGALYAQQGKAVLLNASWTYEAISLFGTKDAHPWDDTASPQAIGQILLDGRVDVAPRIAFICGGKWESSSKELAHVGDLARRNRLIPILDSNVYYCYGSRTGQPLAQTQPELSRSASQRDGRNVTNR